MASQEYQEEFVDFVSSIEALAEQRKPAVRVARDMIGELIEALRRDPSYSLDAELDDVRENVDIGPQAVQAPVFSHDDPQQERDVEASSENESELLTNDDVVALAKKMYKVYFRFGSKAGRAQAYLHLRGDKRLNDVQARDVLNAMNCYKAVSDFKSGKDLKEGRREAKKREKKTGTPCFFCTAETTA